MMVVDSSMVVAMLLGEPDYYRCDDILAKTSRSYMSAVNVYETKIVLRRRGGIPAVDAVTRFLSHYAIVIVPFEEASARAAAAAYDRYGKGIDPKARLNLADCAAYGLARRSICRFSTRGRISTRPTSAPAFDRAKAIASGRAAWPMITSSSGRGRPAASSPTG